MLDVSNIDQPVVGLPAIGHYGALDAHFASDKPLECLGFYIGHDFGKDSAAKLERFPINRKRSSLYLASNFIRSY